MLMYMHWKGYASFDVTFVKNFHMQGWLEVSVSLLLLRSVLLEILEQKDTFQSLKEDLLPYLVRSQLVCSLGYVNYWLGIFLLVVGWLVLFNEWQKSEIPMNGTPPGEENGNEKIGSHNNQVLLSRILSNASKPEFHQLHELGCNGATTRRAHKCCVYIASDSKYCARLNTIQAFSDINRDVGVYWSNSVLYWAFGYFSRPYTDGMFYVSGHWRSEPFVWLYFLFSPQYHSSICRAWC